MPVVGPVDQYETKRTFRHLVICCDLLAASKKGNVPSEIYFDYWLCDNPTH